MKYAEEFRDREIASALARQIHARIQHHRRLVFMEVCGTHTMSIFKYGIRDLLPEAIQLIAGPGCPVCVTPVTYVDRAVAYSRLDDVIVATFGDMLRVPGSSISLEKSRAQGSRVTVVFSPMEAVEIARAQPEKTVVFLGIGFETTAPNVAVSIKEADRRGITNYLVLCAHKVIPPVMKALVEDKEIDIDGFLCPGHVSTIIGARPYEFLAREYRKTCVISGFEPLDILRAIDILVERATSGQASVDIEYSRVVRPEGNPRALELLSEVFEVCDSEWRGLGVIPGSGLKIKQAYSRFDAEARLAVEVETASIPQGCICGDVLRGIKTPADCVLFQTACSPENPVGACMVSHEGTCATWHRYGE